MAKKSSNKRTVKKAYRTAEKAARKNPKAFWATVAILLVLVLILGAIGYWLYATGRLDRWLDPSGNQDNNGGVAGDIPAGDLADISSADLSIHFLELGVANVGDCVLIKSGNTEVLIDAGAKATTAPSQAMLDYVATYCTDGVLEYVIATHAHEDHIAGLVGQQKGNSYTGFLYQYRVGTIIQFAGTNQKMQTDKGNDTLYAKYVAATEYCAEQGTQVYTALQCWNETDGAKKTYYLNDSKTLAMNILYQRYYEETASTENNYSVCMLLTQTIGQEQYNYLFTGDLESGGEKSLAESNDLPHCVLYKGGHHGSSTSSSDVLLKEITPENIAICTCAGTYEYASKPNEDHPDRYKNTFPTQEAIDRMSRYTKKIYVTTVGILNEDYSTKGFQSMNGNIVFYYGKKEEEEQKSLKLWCSNNDTILKDTEWFAQNRVWNGVA